MHKKNTLTPEEARIILHKGTEAPFSGEYWKTKTKGTYICRQCEAPLFHSADKFESMCGWPSFDDAIEGAVLRRPDADGQRTEIVCATCGGHLGHVFEGEGLTAKNLRHCVNSLSMRLVANKDEKTSQATAYFAGGCFWGVEDAFSKVPGVLDVVSGYMGGNTAKPNYDEVSSGRTGHAEAVRVTFDPAKVTYESLARLFFEIHDPTQLDRQGPDMGTQYRSALFYLDDAQRKTAEHLVDLLRQRGWKVVTEISPASEFYLAEDYHQDFTRRTGRGACHVKVPRFDTSPARK